MVRWTVFAILSLVWIVVCYVLGGLLGTLLAEGPAGEAREACAQRIVAAAAVRGHATDLIHARTAPECREAYRRTHEELSASSVRKGLLWGVVPAVLIGGLMVLRRGE